MEFLTPEQKRTRSRRLLVGYGLFSVLIVLATYIMVSTALGYEIFTSKGDVVQNGLLFVDSRPDNADIYVNGKRESSGTNAKLSLPEGTYSISLQKSGYNEWRRDVDLFGGAVKFLTYPRLLPTNPTELASSDYTADQPRALQSRDKRWVALYAPALAGEWHVKDLNDPTRSVYAFTLPVSVIGESSIADVSFIEWAGDNVHFMSRLTMSDGSKKLVVINREKPEESIEITKLYALSGEASAGFWDGKWDRLALYDGATMRLAELKDKSVSATPIVAEQVSQYFLLGSESMIYTTKLADNSFAVKLYKDAKTYLITSYEATDKPLLVKAAGFNRNDYILIAGGGLQKALLYRNVIDSIQKSDLGRATPFVTLPITSVSVIDFSRSNRFAMASDGANINVYDLEQKELFKYEMPVAQPAVIGWFDDARLYAVDKDRSLYVFDFDGMNSYQLSSKVEGIPYVNGSVEVASFFRRADTGIINLKVIDIVSQSK